MDPGLLSIFDTVSSLLTIAPVPTELSNIVASTDLTNNQSAY
jgi:hypothetical protein